MYKFIGGFLGVLGIAAMVYFNEFSSTAPNSRLALVGAVIFLAGIILLLVHRSKSRSVGKAQDKSPSGA